MKTPKLLLFNGVGQRDRRGKEWVHFYVAAHSRVDAARMMEQLCYRPSWNGTIAQYWGQCWGKQMAGITPECGVWGITRIDSGESKVERIL